MWRRRILYAFVLLCALAGQLFDTGYLFHYIFFLTLTLPALGFLVSLPAMLGLRARAAAGLRTVERGHPVSWALTLENRFSLPLACVKGKIRILNNFTGENRRFRLNLRGVVPGEYEERPVNTSHCGLAEYRTERLWVCDCLGLFALPVRLPAAGTLLICPVPERPAAVVLPESSGMPMPVPRGKSASGEDYELRPYQPGDSLRAIHWKMTAKRDELVTRELLEDRRPLPVLTMDHFGTPDSLDRVLDRLYGYSLELLDMERPHEVRWAHPGTGTVRRYEVSCERDWMRCLAALLGDPLPIRGRSILEQPLSVGQDVTVCPIHITGEEARHDA